MGSFRIKLQGPKNPRMFAAGPPGSLGSIVITGQHSVTLQDSDTDASEERSVGRGKRLTVGESSAGHGMALIPPVHDMPGLNGPSW